MSFEDCDLGAALASRFSRDTTIENALFKGAGYRGPITPDNINGLPEGVRRTVYEDLRSFGAV